MAVSDDEKKQWLKQAVHVAMFAGARVRQWGSKRNNQPDALQTSEKGPQDLVTAADRFTEQLIVDELRSRFPTHAFVAEEGTRIDSADQPVWIIDPIDGTTNFVHALPHVAVSIGLVVDGHIELGVVHLPFLDETFEAARGLGAFCDTRRLQVSSTSTMRSAIVAMAPTLLALRDEAARNRYHAVHDAVLTRGADVRSLGSAAAHLAYVAAGRLDGYIEQHLYAWDTAAGLCLVREAGGQDNGIPDNDVAAWVKNGAPLVCGNAALYGELAQLSALNAPTAPALSR